MARVGLRKVERTVFNGQVSSRRDNIEVVALDRHPVCRLKDSHGRMTGQQIHHHAFVCGVEMLDQDEGHTAVGWQRVQEAPADVKTACGGANCHNREEFGVSRGTAGWRNSLA